jgi:hypothetical protein
VNAVKRFGVRARSLQTGEWLWARNTGTLTASPHFAARFGNQSHAFELARRLPRWQETEVAEIDAQAPEASEEKVATAVTTSTATDWTNAGEVGLQERRLASGEVKYRKRAAGKVSPSFPTLEDARTWEP